MSETLNKRYGRALNWAFALVVAAALAAVLVTFVRTWIPGYGLTRMIPIGREFNRRGTAVYRATPKYMDPYPPDRWGFDGQLYAELSLDPLLRDPGLKTALDNPPYRADRILLSWLAWLGGLGHPYWVLNVFAALNGVFWLGYAALLVKLFRPFGWAGLAGCAAMLLTCGVVESIYRTLTDFPAFVLLIAAGMAGGVAGGVLLALSGLTREVDLLGYLGLVELKPPWGRALRRDLLIGLASGLPCLAWFAYVRWRFPERVSMAGDNFDWPLHAVYLRLLEVLAAARRGELVWTEFYKRGTEMHALLTIVATLTQCAYVLTHPAWRNRLWKIGALFVPFFLCVSTNVWGSFSYFTVTRHALPITLAFNLVLAARPTKRWLVWFLLGNCFVPAGVCDFLKFGEIVPRVPGFVVEAPPPLDAEVSVRFASGWSGPERNTHKAWRWATDRNAALVVDNASGRRLAGQLAFTTLTLVPRDLRVVADGRVVWLGHLDPKPLSLSVRTVKFALTPGGTRVLIASPQAPAPPGPSDPRTLSVMVADLTVEAAPAP